MYQVEYCCCLATRNTKWNPTVVWQQGTSSGILLLPGNKEHQVESYWCLNEKRYRYKGQWVQSCCCLATRNIMVTRNIMATRSIKCNVAYVWQQGTSSSILLLCGNKTSLQSCCCLATTTKSLQSCCCLATRNIKCNPAAVGKQSSSAFEWNHSVWRHDRNNRWNMLLSINRE